MNRQAVLQRPSPVRLRLPFNFLTPPVGRNRTVRSSASKVRTIQKPTATVASRVCSRLLILRRCLGRHPLAAAVAVPMLAAVAPVVESGINFYPYDFQKYIFDGSWIGSGIAGLCFCTGGASFFFTKRRRQRVGGGSHKS